MNIEEKENLLLKHSYSAKDVMALSDVKHTRAQQIMNECRAKYGGSIAGRNNVITSASYWAREGTTREEELRIILYAKESSKKL